MITPKQVLGLLKNSGISDEIFIVEITVKPGNKIMVYADTMKGINIDECVSVSRAIEHQLDREVEDFELEASSPGLLQPFKVIQQYQKNIDRQVEVIRNEGEKLYGKLLSVNDTSFVIESKGKFRQEGKKKAENVVTQHEINLVDVKSTKLVINF